METMLEIRTRARVTRRQAVRVPIEMLDSRATLREEQRLSDIGGNEAGYF